MFVIDSINTDGQENGVWAEFKGSRFLIASLSNLNYQRELARLQQPHRRNIEKGTVDPVVLRDILCGALARGILKDWENVVDSSGRMVPFSVDTAARVLAYNEDLRDFVVEFAGNVDNYRAEAVEDTVKP